MKPTRRWLAAATASAAATATVGAALVLGVGPDARAAEATQPAVATAPVAGRPLTVTVTEVVGMVQVRPGEAEDERWQAARVGMVLGPGAEFRTGQRSFVRFRIPPDQIITVDRLSTVKVLTAISQGATQVKTDLGMRYGRTTYEVEEAGITHDATIRAPGASLAVRGTRNMQVEDHGPFVPVARASQPVRFRADNRTVAFGRAGSTATVEAGKSSPGETALPRSTVDPSGKAQARSAGENAVLNYVQAAAPNLNVNRFALLRQALDPNFQGSASFSLPVAGQLAFAVVWQGRAGTDVDLIIRGPGGEFLSPMQTTSGASGVHSGNGVAGANGIGSETAVFQVNYRLGTYRVETVLQKGARADTTVAVVRDPLTQGQQIAVFNQVLREGRPRRVYSVPVTRPDSTSTPTTPNLTDASPRTTDRRSKR